MGVTSRPAGRRTRWIIVSAAGSLALALLLAAVIVATRPDTPKAQPTPSAAPSAAELSFERPEGWSPYRPSFHLTPGEHWINDPQRPFFAGGEWHLYYLYNADYPDGNGTEWYHATSDDLVSWQNQGVAIEKYRNGLGDILTGSAVVDTEGTAGFGRGAVVALVTQQDDGVQRQSLFYSTDNGYSFQGYDGNPVMDNPGVVDWRDPKVLWDEVNAQWVMVLAEGERLGFYVSPDLRSWRYVSDFARDDLGLLECADLFEMTDASGRRTWILAASADGTASGRTTGLVYWTGTWDGSTFTADVDDPLWLDDGADFYAAVTWDDPRQSEAVRLESRFALGWINNWAYARDLPPEDWQGGALSLTRRLTLVEEAGRLVLRSQPVDALADYAGEARTAETITVEPGNVSDLALQPDDSAYRLQTTLDVPDSGEVRLRLFDTGATAVTVGYDADRDVVFVNRERDTAAPDMPEVYREIRTTGPLDSGGTLALDIVVDHSSVEVFVGDGRASLTTAVYPAESTRISVEAVGDEPVTLRDLRVAPIAVAQKNGLF
ncbi:glycoside hydrolase family 32 protein [Microbacterium aurantiacum]|uniref:Glycoside hydrolase family 32 protein n=1 Tax=Microbacterium aurantiacum TaxID=162393 RepID=A0ABT8FWK8_9MICO|nr:glycoside hydrolase family 32 protein [Microbacterium aurantiacum]MDN4465691.1 glycoside hydrolase family 32 protein [Microbacterium aurantiacum]